MVEAETVRKVENIVDGMAKEMVTKIQELVRIPSIVGKEAPAQEYVEDLYKSFGLDVTVFQPDIDKIKNHPGFIKTGMSYENRPNIIGILPGNPDAPSLILNGHIDVVSPEPIEAWTHDPWGGEVSGDRLYGRGSADMKSGLIANFFALKALKELEIYPKGTVMLHSVIDEEAGGAGGALACLAEGFRADAMVCTEPHNLNLTISCAGICYFRVKVQGKTSHAGLAHLGVNAIGKIIPIYNALVELDRIRGSEIKFPLFEKGSGRSCHLSIGTLHAGDWPSTVAGNAEMECRIGFVPGESRKEIKEKIKTLISEIANKDEWLKDHPPQVEWFGWQTDPWYQEPEHAFVQTFKNALDTATRRDTSLAGRAGGVDARFSTYFDMAAVCTGPKGANIHGIDEYVEIPSVISITKALALAIIDWCGIR